MMNRFLDTMWGQANALFTPFRRRRWVDLLLVAAAFGMLYGLILLGHQWTAIQRPLLEMDLSPWALPKYTFFSMMRGLAAYLLSFTFTLVYAYWAAKDTRSERLLIPLLDILQSIPVMAFIVPLMLALVAAFPHSNIGIELTAIIAIFTGQAWNMTFSLYHSLKSVPADLHEAATVYRFNWWQRFKWVELPFATTGLAWNSMMSMAGGWFFLMLVEAFKLGDKDFRVPGLGSYMSLAVERGDVRAQLWAVAAMILMIVLLDQVLWRPIVVWAQRFRIEDTMQVADAQSWFLNLIRGSRLIRRWDRWRAKRRRLRQHHQPAKKVVVVDLSVDKAAHAAPWLSLVALVFLAGFLVLGGFGIVRLLHQLPSGDWWTLLKAAGLTLSRVMASILIGLCWTLPAGLAISGRVDRMTVTPDRVLVVDFKTNRPAPDRVDNADPAYLTQMAVYVAVLRAIFPGRRVDAALVWTDGPKLMPVPENLIVERLNALRRAS